MLAGGITLKILTRQQGTDMSEMDIDEIKRRMEASLTSLQNEFMGLRVGRANPAMLEPIFVDAYGSKMPLNQVGKVKGLCSGGEILYVLKM